MNEQGTDLTDRQSDHSTTADKSKPALSVNQRMRKGNKSALVRESSDFEVSLKPEKAAGKKAHPHHLHRQFAFRRKPTVTTRTHVNLTQP